jgi:hypothetical protein
MGCRATAGLVLLVGVFVTWTVDASAQVRTEPAALQCPSVLGVGRLTSLEYCDVMTGRDIAEGIIIALPPRQGSMTLSFNLHNRHTFSEELVRSGRGYRRYTATIGVLTPNNDLLTRAVVQNEFRSAADLEDRITGGAGPGGVKAVAPSGTERVVLTIAADINSVSILGEKLAVDSPDGTTDNFNAPGRPIAIISNVTLEYRPR